MKISIITVTYNAGDSLLKTVQSVLAQNYDDYELLIQDAESTDGSILGLPSDPRIKVISEKDNGIYDAMNRAAHRSKGDYLLFLNSGDTLYTDDTLEKVVSQIESSVYKAELFYGDVFLCARNVAKHYPEYIDDYYLVTHTICHQVILFKRSIFDILQYDYEQFEYAADMALYVKCLKMFNMTLIHLNLIIANYQGGGVSDKLDSKKNTILKKKQIAEVFLNKDEYKKYRRKYFLSFMPIKDKLGTSKFFFPIYEKLAELRYRLER